MNYLELVNDFLLETDYSDQVASLTNLQDDEQRAAVWVRDAWTQIQRQERWSFMSREGSLPTVIGKDEYSLYDIDYPLFTTQFVQRVDPLSFRNEDTESRLIVVNYESLRWQDTTGSVTRIGLNENNRTVKLSPVPSKVETITMDTWHEPIILTLDTDTPSMAPSFHKAIVWLAVANYAREQGGEWRGLRQAAHQEYNQMYHNLTNAYLPLMGPKVGLL